jgi:hypothetical protein
MSSTPFAPQMLASGTAVSDRLAKAAMEKHMAVGGRPAR